VQLYYYNGKVREYKTSNFGDDLNPWLWDKLLPNFFDDNDESIFIGIGTLLNERLPKKPRKIVFGSGVGYGEAPKIDQNWHIYFVRGKLSAKALELAETAGISDPALLVRNFWQTQEPKKFAYSYMPHYHEEVFNGAAWQEICTDLKIHYINPTAPIEQVLSEIQRSEVLLTEAMHGAIVADALRVPWVAVRTRRDILEFKWQDWLSTVDLSYQPLTLKRFASRIGKEGVLRYCDYQLIRAQLLYLKQIAKPQLSALAKQNELEEKIMLKVEQIQQGY
jgi:succinoglycan biosynthesis protein ExoV